jgi:hypothetical protein
LWLTSLDTSQEFLAYLLHLFSAAPSGRWTWSSPFVMVIFGHWPAILNNL